MTKRALITGITGQDGAYLSQTLLEKGYEVYGAFRRSSSSNLWRLEELGIADSVKTVSLELLEYSNILKTVEAIQPDELYNLAAQSFVGISFDQPLFTSDVNAIGAARLLEVVRTVNPRIRFYQASTSEMFGKVRETPQTEQTPFHPRSPYAVSKVYAHHLMVNYRESYGLFACSGILFNHESPLRGREFVTRKITASLARISHGSEEVLELGNMDSRRDWGFAGDYVVGMWMMLQQTEPDDYLLATGETHSVREFLQHAAEAAGFSPVFEGEGVDTQVVDRTTGRLLARCNPEFYRPTEVDTLLGDASKARKRLGWQNRVRFDALVEMMAKADRDRLHQGRSLM